MKELDAEIEGELEAALAGISGQDLLAAETSAHVRQRPVPRMTMAASKAKCCRCTARTCLSKSRAAAARESCRSCNFPKGRPKPGTTVDVSIEGYDRANGLLILTRLGAAVVANWSSIAEGMTVEARVLETNTGGLAVDINGIRGFMPISQIDLYRVENTAQFVNQKLLCLVTEANQEERNLVVSRRALLEKQRAELREKTWASWPRGRCARASCVRCATLGPSSIWGAWTVYSTSAR